MDNRPVGREKRVISGGTGIRRTGEGLGKAISERGVKKEIEKQKEQIRKIRKAGL